MVDAFGSFVILSAFVFTSGVFVGYYLYEDFDGIMLGVIGATAFLYLMRELLLGWLKNVV